MPLPRAPLLPIVARELRVLLARWHLWVALSVVGATDAALVYTATPLDGARPALLAGLVAAWLCALPVVIACGAADDRGVNLALLIQLGHGPARVTLAKAGASLAGAALLAVPTVTGAALLAARGATVAIPAASLVALAAAAALAVGFALLIAALVGDSGWAALATLLGTLGALWLDDSGAALALLSSVQSGVVPLATMAQLVVGAATLLSLASVWSSPVASGERRAVRSAIALTAGTALFAAAGRVPGVAGSGVGLDVRARAAQATALGELGGAVIVTGAAFLLVGLLLAWRRRP